MFMCVRLYFYFLKYFFLKHLQNDIFLLQNWNHIYWLQGYWALDAPFRDDEYEDQMQQIIYASARGEDAGGEDDDFSSQFSNDYGERAEVERRDEGHITNSGGEVY